VAEVTDQLAVDGLDDGSTDRATGDGVDDAVDRSESAGTDDSAPAPEPPGRRRVSRWDRPPEPHDWRFFVGNLGRILIATGLLMFGFVAYQLWGTGIETARAQSQLENRFETLLAEFDTPVGPTVPDDGQGDIVVPPREFEPAAVPAVVPVAIDLSDQAVVQDPLPQPFRGEPLLRLEIPRIGRDDIVVPGVTLDDLKDGPGHYPDTPLPGQLGNAAIAGHRTTYGAPFFDVDQLAAGDEIITTLLNGDRFVYEVTFVEVVSASDYAVVTTRDPDIAELTLTSCHPKYTARDRIVVHSVLNPEKSSNVGFPTFYSLEDAPEADAIAGDDPVIEGAGSGSTLGETDRPATAETSSDGQVEVTDPADARAEIGATVGENDAPPARAPVAAAPVETTTVDAFGRGWFDDRAAIVQVVLWSMALAIISLLAYQVSKKYRNTAIGLLVGAAPFLVALYFFYQNVNRLLPPGI
jgi:sortase A